MPHLYHSSDSQKVTILITAIILMFIANASIASAAVSATPPAKVATADAPKVIGTWGNWTSYTATENDQPICYMATRLTPLPIKGLRRGEIFVTITHRPTENVIDEVSYTAGARLKPSSDVTVTIDGRKFTMFTRGEAAWSRDSAADRTLTAAIRSGKIMKIDGIAQKAQKLSDEISLTGSTAAYRAMSKACGVAIPEVPKARAANPVKK